MEKLHMVEKLISKTNISYEEAKNVLDKCQWDILDAIVYLEKNNIIKSPKISEYITKEESKEEGTEALKEKMRFSKEKKNEDKKKGVFERVIERACQIIDWGNNIFFNVKKDNKNVIKLPITVLILLLFFAFWIIIPLFVVALFCNIEFSVYGKNIDTKTINEVLKYLSVEANKIKENINRGHNHD